jgi:serine protease Do
MKNKSSFGLVLGCLLLGTVVGAILNDRPSVQAQSSKQASVVIPKELYSYRDIVKKVVPAVVSIESKMKAQRGGPSGEQTTVPMGYGSGVIIDPKGLILTNYHVVNGAESVEVRLPDGRKFAGKDIHTDRKTDVATIRINSDKPLPFLELGDSDAMEVGDRVLAVGSPFGLAGSVTHGIISAKSRNIRINQYEDFLQTDAAINPGNSGGPLINLEGKVIGINSAIKSKSGGFQGVGLAISSNLARTIMNQLEKEGVVKRAYLGVQIRDIDADLGARLRVAEGSGVVVTKIFDESPAAKGGLQVTDILTSISGKPVRDGTELSKVVAKLPVNAPVLVDLIRNGKPMQLRLVVWEQPEEFGTIEPSPKTP